MLNKYKIKSLTLVSRGLERSLKAQTYAIRLVRLRESKQRLGSHCEACELLIIRLELKEILTGRVIAKSNVLGVALAVWWSGFTFVGGEEEFTFGG